MPARMRVADAGLSLLFALAALPAAAQSTALPASLGTLYAPSEVLALEYTVERDVDLALHLTPDEAEAARLGLIRFAEALIAQPMFRPTRAFHTLFHGSLVAADSATLASGVGSVPQRLLIGAVGVDLSFAELAYRGRRRGPPEDHMLDARVNQPALARGASLPLLRASFMRQPRQTGRLGGVPIYENEYAVVARRDEAQLWRPVPVERVLVAYLTAIQEGRAIAYRQLARNVSVAEAHPDSATNAAANPSSSSRDGRWFWSWQEASDSLLARLEAMPAAQLDSPACFADRVGLEAAFQFVQVDSRQTPGCAPVVEIDPAFLRPELPRASIQLAILPHVGFCARTMRDLPPQVRISLRSGCAAVLKLLNEADWGRVRKTMDR